MTQSEGRTVAIVGASANRAKYSNKSVRAHLAQGWKVYPINPKGGEIEGLRVYTSLSEIGMPLDRVSMYLPPEVGITMLEEVAEAAPREFFVNPGAESAALVDKARELGLVPILACSIVDVGRSPNEFTNS